MGKSRKRKHSEKEDNMERILRKLEKLENKVSHLSRQDVRSPALYRDESWEAHDDRRSLSPDTLSGILTEEGADKENIEIVEDLPPEEASADKGDPSCEPKDTVDGNENLSSVVTQPLNEEVLKILGKDLASPPDPEQNMHPDLASRWRFVLSKGLPKEVKKEILDKYSRKSFCCLEVPELNPEIKASLNETASKRDDHFCYSQNLAGSALSALSLAITKLFSKDEALDNLKLIEYISDAEKLIAELHHKESIARRAFILPGLQKKTKTLLENTDIGPLLFSDKLGEKLKEARSLEKMGKDLKPQVPLKKPFNKSNFLNQKSSSGKNQETSQASKAR
ncbi:hypothetical protein ACS0PU_002740 [Formica fusca]